MTATLRAMKLGRMVDEAAAGAAADVLSVVRAQHRLILSGVAESETFTNACISLLLGEEGRMMWVLSGCHTDAAMLGCETIRSDAAVSGVGV